MSLTSVILVAAAAILHALWNLISKAEKPSASFFLVASLASALISIPAFFWTSDIAVSAPTQVWKLLALTSVFEAVYYISLANAYKHGEISMTYPLIRALPAVMLPPLTAFLGFGKTVSPLACTGILIIALGCMMMPLKSFRGIKIGAYFKLSALLSVLAAVAVAAYSIIDSEALKILKEGTEKANAFKASLFYMIWMNVMIIPFLVLYTAMRKGEREAFMRYFNFAELKAPCTAGPICTLAYLLTLAAMLFCTNVSLVIAFKQLSIPLAAAAGILLFKENTCKPKITGCMLIVYGLVMTAIF